MERTGANKDMAREIWRGIVHFIAYVNGDKPVQSVRVFNS